MNRVIHCHRCGQPLPWHALKVDGWLCIACLKDWHAEQRQQGTVAA